METFVFSVRLQPLRCSALVLRLQTQQPRRRTVAEGVLSLRQLGPKETQHWLHLSPPSKTSVGVLLSLSLLSSLPLYVSLSTVFLSLSSLSLLSLSYLGSVNNVFFPLAILSVVPPEQTCECLDVLLITHFFVQTSCLRPAYLFKREESSVTLAIVPFIQHQ